MRPLSSIAFVCAIIVSSSVGAQTAPSQAAPPQTARQALIEMFFGEAPNHVEKHLPDVTRQSFEKIEGTNGQNVRGLFSGLAEQAKTGRAKLKTFEAGSTFMTFEEPAGGFFEKLVLTVEKDDLAGDEDHIELVPHMFKDGKEEALLPIIVRLSFAMKMESQVWRLSQVDANFHFPLEDPVFLKGMEEHQLRQNEQMALWSMRSVINAERMYQAAQGGFACTLPALGGGGEAGAKKRAYLWDAQLASGKKNGYVFTISGCDASGDSAHGNSHYRIAAEPVVQGSGQRAFCADESGTVRASADGKAATCFARGEIVEQKVPNIGGLGAGASPQSYSASGTSEIAGRVRVSYGVSEGLLVTKVAPTYPDLARSARIQGTVVMKALISKMGEVESLELISGHPMLAPAALEAVKQWKYRPYMLNGNAVAVETQIKVNFALSEQK
jgi:TonB family protein